MHVFGDDELAQIAFADLPLHQMHRDHAKGLTACRLRRRGHSPHQPHIARAIHQTLALLRQCRPKRARAVFVGRRPAVS